MQAARLRQGFDRWVERRHRPAVAVRLGRQRIYILPTPAGYAFALLLLILFLWSVNYSNSMGFALTFLLAGAGLNAMWLCRNNLLGLQVSAAGAEPVFAGQPVAFDYWLSQDDGRLRCDVGLRAGAAAPAYCDVDGNGANARLTLPASRRGWLSPGRVRVDTRYPLGLLQAWSWLYFTQRCLVYPAPQGNRPLPLPAATDPRQVGDRANGLGQDDFAELRGYRFGDSPRHIAWRASQRGDQLLVKRFQGQALPELWLDWAALDGLPPEARLSQLCQWVLAADRAGYDYGLRLPDGELAPAGGEPHRQACLRRLALFGIDDD